MATQTHMVDDEGLEAGHRVDEGVATHIADWPSERCAPPFTDNTLSIESRVRRFLQSDGLPPYLLLAGDALTTLRCFPAASVDMVITSPPYWHQRDYGGSSGIASGQAIGEEPSVVEYVQALGVVFNEVWRVLKPSGSFWLNIGDTYNDKRQSSIPWRVAIHLQDMQGWILRNDVVWHKVKGAPDNAKDKLRNVHEFLFHFVKQRSYYYDVDAIRNDALPTSIKDGVLVTGTGVSGVNYRRQIMRSTSLSETEKQAALQTLDAALIKVANGEISDFRMIIRGQQRTTHSDSTLVSGRAVELAKKGFYILPYHAKGSKPGDVWDIIPEDEWRTDSHCAPFPLQLCTIPIKATCPLGGVVLDPFLGTGTSALATLLLQRRFIGIDLYQEYIDTAEARLTRQLGFIF